MTELPEHPLVTVVMPVRNEAEFIARSLGAVLAQDYPPDCLEVLVVDGESDDGTREVVDAFVENDRGIPIRVLTNERRIVPEGLNRALAVARGAVIVRVDGHCLIASDYIRRCIQTLRSSGAACVGGAMSTVGDSKIARAIALAQSSPFGVGGVAFRTGARQAGPVDTVPFGAYRRDVFDRVGTFDTELVRNQDDEFNYRLNRRGELVWLDPTIRSTYYSRASLRRLWRQYFEYGFYKVPVIQRHGIGSVRHLVPAAFVGGIATGAVASAVFRRPLWLAVVALPYLVIDIVASLLTARRDRSLIPLLPASFAAIHTGYGLGFLLGIWKWRTGFRSRSRSRRSRLLSRGSLTKNSPDR